MKSPTSIETKFDTGYIYASESHFFTYIAFVLFTIFPLQNIKNELLFADVLTIKNKFISKSLIQASL